MDKPTDDDESPSKETFPPLTEKEREAIRKMEADRDEQIHDYLRKRDVWPRS